MRQRLILSFLLSIALVYFALPELTLNFENMSGWFGIVWLAFALTVIGGNLVGILYGPKRKQRIKVRKINRKPLRQRSY